MIDVSRALWVLLVVSLLSGCELISQPPSESAEGLQPEKGPHYDQIKDRYTQDPDLLVGTWTWQWSLHPDWESGLLTSTPRSTGKTVSLVFGADDSVRAYENGELTWSESYRVARREYGNGSISEYPMLFIGDNSMEFAVIEDTLLTNAMDRDGPESVYAGGE